MRTLNFSINYPLPAGPHAGLVNSLAKKIQDNPQDVFKNVSNEKLVLFSEIAAKWMNVDSRCIAFGIGGHHILNSIVSGFTNPGDALASEEITYNGWLDICRNQGRRSIPIPRDSEGMIPEALDQAAAREKIWGIFLMPSLHNPLSTVMPLERRKAITDVCRKHGLWVIDDDAYRFLNPIPTPGFAHLYPEKTFWIHSFTKSLFPSLKTGMVFAPQSAIAALVTSLRYQPSSLTLPWIMDLMASGELDQILIGKQGEARLRQAMASEVLKDHSYETAPTSFHLWLKAPGSWEPHGISVVPGHRYYHGKGPAPEYVRITLAGETEIPTVHEGLRIIADQLRP